MKKCLEILDFEEKSTQAGKTYVRFKTSDGWMSCFDGKSNEELKKLKGTSANVEVVEKGEFKNIKKFLGAASESVDVTPEKVDEVPKETKVNRNIANGNFPKSMKVAYVKDIFCAIVTRISQSKFDDMEDVEVLGLMDLSIETLKKAEKAFD